MSRPILGLVLGVLLLGGCSIEQENAEDSIGPAKVTFDGKIDETLVGIWRSEKGDSVLDLGADGKLKIESNFNTPNGPQHTAKHGNWLAGEENLKLRYEDTDGSIQTISYLFKRTGDTMVLSTKTPKLATTYQRK